MNEKSNKKEEKIENIKIVADNVTNNNTQKLLNSAEKSKKDLTAFTDRIKKEIQRREEKTSQKQNVVTKQVEKKIENQKQSQATTQKDGKKFQKNGSQNQQHNQDVKAQPQNKNQKPQQNKNQRRDNVKDGQNWREINGVKTQQNKNSQQNKNQQQNTNKLSNYQKDGKQRQQNSGYVPKKNVDTINKRPTQTQMVTAQKLEKSTKKETDRQYKDKKGKDYYKNSDKKSLTDYQLRKKGMIVEDEDRQHKQRAKKKETVENVVREEPKLITNAVLTKETISVREFSELIGRPAIDILQKLLELNVIGANINSFIDSDSAEIIADTFGVTLEMKIGLNNEAQFKKCIEDSRRSESKNKTTRAPIVVVMGHVDHGKTSLLDAIRNTKVVEGEAGGITQKLSAYTIATKRNVKITFVDTPGHEIFMNMRELGAKKTDIAILIVAADTGVQPQTVEAIKIIKECNLPMIVAINKVDKATQADIAKVKNQLAENDILLEEWGGDVQCVEISAKQKMNIDNLLQAIELLSEILDLKGDASQRGMGYIQESVASKYLGVETRIVIRDGSINVGDSIVTRTTYGKVKALMDENGKKIKKAGPSTPVTIYGLKELPLNGDDIFVVDDKNYKELVDLIDKNKPEARGQVLSIEKMAERTSKKILSIIVKADSQGSAQAIKKALLDICKDNEEIMIEVLTAESGMVTETDILNASIGENTLILCFNQKANPKAKQLADKQKIDIREYSIIYKLLEDVEQIVKGMMAPKYTEIEIGKAEIRQVFNLSTSGLIAGSYVLEGKIQRNAKCRIYRKNKIVAETVIDCLKYKKDDVKEIGVQFECGIKFENYKEFQVGDIIEAYILERIS